MSHSYFGLQCISLLELGLKQNHPHFLDQPLLSVLCYRNFLCYVGVIGSFLDVVPAASSMLIPSKYCYFVFVLRCKWCLHPKATGTFSLGRKCFKSLFLFDSESYLPFYWTNWTNNYSDNLSCITVWFFYKQTFYKCNSSKRNSWHCLLGKTEK